MNPHRPLEIALGVVTLLSVVSVPLPQRKPYSMPAAHRFDIDRLGALHREAQSQRDEVLTLTRETRQLSQMVRALSAPRSTHDGGTVRRNNAPPQGHDTEIEDVVCSQ